MTVELAEADPFARDVSQEDETDLESDRADAVLTATDWTTETILSQLRRGNIDLAPRFQRREAWTDFRKSTFIESLFLGLPVPQLVLAERRDKRGSFIVIDGKQRLLAIRRFGAVKNQDPFTPLVLRGLAVRRDLNGKTLADLKEDESRQDDVTWFENQTIRTVVVKNWPEEAFLYRVFLRLNTGSVPLSPQELRQALHPGPFLDFVDDFVSQSPSIQMALGIDAPDFRMRDVELLIRFYAFERFLSSYNGNFKHFLDETCKHLNSAWAANSSDIVESAQQCASAIDATIAIFGEDAFRRWSGDKFERRFNRAVFDVMVYYFRSDTVAAAARRNAQEVRRQFVELCSTSSAFVEAVQTTTKSVYATHSRIRLWGERMRALLDTPVNVPKLEAGRIVV